MRTWGASKTRVSAGSCLVIGAAILETESAWAKRSMACRVLAMHGLSYDGRRHATHERTRYARRRAGGSRPPCTRVGGAPSALLRLGDGVLRAAACRGP